MGLSYLRARCGAALRSYQSPMGEQVQVYRKREPGETEPRRRSKPSEGFWWSGTMVLGESGRGRRGGVDT